MIIGMGSFRLFLAFLVVISHLYANMIHGYAAYAVWGFFLLSGYLMTRVLNLKYGFDKEGLTRYAINRFLRIFPTYWLALVLGAIVLYILSKYGINATSLNPQFHAPTTFKDWIGNLFLFQIFGTSGAYVPVSGALATEVGAYFVIIFLALNRSTTLFAIVFAFLINLHFRFSTDSFALRYATFITAFLAFAVGALIFHYEKKIKFMARPKLSLIVWVLHGLVWFVIPAYPWTYGLYISLFLTAWVVVSLIDLKPTKFDILMGDLSYPVYLLHTTVGGLLLIYFDATRSFSFFLASFFVTLLVSWIIVLLVDRPIQKIKIKINTTKESLFTEANERSFLNMIKTKIKIIVFLVGIVAILFSAFYGYNIYATKELKVYEWGPKQTIVSHVPNKQPSGDAGIWLKTSQTLGLGKLELYVNGKPIYTQIDSNTITGIIPKELFQQEGSLQIQVLHVKTKQYTEIGVLKINARDNK